MTNLNSSNLEDLFTEHFPKLKYYPKSNEELIAYLTKEEYILYIRFKFTNKWESHLYFGDNFDRLFLYQSTDLNELMQVTKQKLTEMFADWSSKIS